MYGDLIENFSVFIWFLIFIIFFFIESKRKDILFIYFSIASFFSGISAIFTKDIEVQIVIFIISSLIFIIFLKIIVDRIVESNFKFKHKKYIEDRFCIIVKEEDEKLFLYKVITKNGIYIAKYISKEGKPKKFKICSIIHDDGEIILIK